MIKMVGKKGRKDLNKKTLICECGIGVKGISEAHAKSNLKSHKKSKIHKKIMANKHKGGKKE